MDAGSWLEALPPPRRPCVEQELERAIRYSSAVARMRRMELHLRASREEGVPLDEIIRSHHVTFTMDTLSGLTDQRDALQFGQLRRFFGGRSAQDGRKRRTEYLRS